MRSIMPMLRPYCAAIDFHVSPAFATTSMRLRPFWPSNHAKNSGLAAASPEFFAWFEGQKGRSRIEVVAKAGDTWKSIAAQYGLSIGMIERINQRARSSALAPGERVVVY